MKLDWQNSLKEIGYPIVAVTLDFETFFDVGYTLRTTPIVEYIADEKFEFTGLGLIGTSPQLDKPWTSFSAPDEIEETLAWLRDRYGYELEKCTIVGANLPFDAMVLAMKFGIYPKYTVDIFDLERYFDPKQLISVEEQAKRAGLNPKGDTKQFKGQHWEDMDQMAMQRYCLNDCEIEFELFKQKLSKLPNPRKELTLAHHTLELFTKPRFDFNFALARDIHYGMMKEKDAALIKVGYTAEELSGHISFAQIIRDRLPDDEPLPLKHGKPSKNMIPITGEGMILAVADGDEGRKILLEHKDPAIRDIMEAKIAQTSWPKWMKRIKSMAMQAKAWDGKMPVPIRYCGAHTKRWTGTQKVNLLNLGGVGRAGSGTHTLISQIRNLLMAPEGMTLGIVDAAQIECRLLAWYAGEDKLLEGFADGKDIYSEFATDLFGVPVYKPTGDDSAHEIKRLTIQRGFGKDAILGCGYGMGASTFYDRCFANKALRPMFEDGTYTLAFIEKLISLYRLKYRNIVKFWETLEKSFTYIARYRNETIELSRGLKFYSEGSTVVIELPSGSKLYYPHVKVRGTGRFSNISYEHGKIYGAMIAENIMQSTSRELLIDVIINCELMLYDVVLHTYDEVVCLIAEGDEETAMKNINGFMCKVPPWADGLPLGSEGFVSKYFKK